MRKILAIIIPILICLTVGYTAGQIQGDSITSWYPLLDKSALTPPNIVFPIAWSILYVCMGLSIGLIIAKDNPRLDFFLSLFMLQLLLNFTWSISFFYLQNPFLGLINILLLELVIVYYAIRTFGSAKISSILFFPYILWVAFATYLNLYILVNN